MKKILTLILSILILTLAGCGENNSAPEKNSSSSEKSSENNSDADKNSKKILIAYFSRADENYNVGEIEKGNTKIIAEMIESETHADMFEIKTVKSYPKDYKKCTEVAEAEKQENARPEILEPLPNIQGYDVIFLGYPIWCGDLPMAVYTFLEKENFSGKIIVPFCTHEGSGLCGTEKIISDKTKAKVLQGFELRGFVVQKEHTKTETEVGKWLKSLKF